MKLPALLAPTLALALAGCGDTAPAEKVARESNAVVPVPQRMAEQGSVAAPGTTATTTPRSDRAVAGSWTRKTMAGDPAALFGGSQTEAAFSVRCEDSALVFSRSALLPAGEAAMQLSADAQTRNLSARAVSEPMPQVTARLPVSDPFTGTLARNDGTISVSVGEGETFTMPSDAILRGVVVDCLS